MHTPSRLNSRTLLVARGVTIFDAGAFGANITARAARLAAAETWNVPHVPEAVHAGMLDIKVTTEVEGDACALGADADADGRGGRRSRRASKARLGRALVPQRYEDFHGSV